MVFGICHCLCFGPLITQRFWAKALHPGAGFKGTFRAVAARQVSAENFDKPAPRLPGSITLGLALGAPFLSG